MLVLRSRSRSLHIENELASACTLNFQTLKMLAHKVCRLTKSVSESPVRKGIWLLCRFLHSPKREIFQHAIFKIKICEDIKIEGLL